MPANPAAHALEMYDVIYMEARKIVQKAARQKVLELAGKISPKLVTIKIRPPGSVTMKELAICYFESLVTECFTACLPTMDTDILMAANLMAACRHYMIEAIFQMPAYPE